MLDLPCAARLQPALHANIGISYWLQFTEFYYSTFDTDRSNLSALYVCHCHSRTCLSRCLLRTGRSQACHAPCLHPFEINMLMRVCYCLQRDHSMLTFEAEQFQGSSSIIEKLKVGWLAHSALLYTSVDARNTPIRSSCQSRTYLSRRYNTRSQHSMLSLRVLPRPA